VPPRICRKLGFKLQDLIFSYIIIQKRKTKGNIPNKAVQESLMPLTKTKGNEILALLEGNAACS